MFVAKIQRSPKVLLVLVLTVMVVAVLIYQQYRRGSVFSLEPGTEYIYRISLESDELITAQKGGVLAKAGFGDLTTHTVFTAELSLRCLQRNDAGYLVSFSVQEPQQHRIRINERDLIPDRSSFDAIFSKQQVYVQLLPDGTIETLYFSPDAPAVFKRLMSGLLGEFQLSVRSDRSWTAREHNRRGDYTAQYSRKGLLSLSGTGIEKRWDRYHELGLVKVERQESEVSAAFTILPASQGYCRSLQGTEKIVSRSPQGEELYSYSSELSIKELRTVPFTPELSLIKELTARYERYPLASAMPDDAAKKMNMEKMAAGLTPEELESLLLKVNSGQIVAKDDITTLLRRAHGMLGLHPELSGRLVDLFVKQELHSATRKLILTMLISHSLPETQAAVRRILTSDEANGDPAFIMMLQSAGFLAAPEKETADMVQRYLEQGSGEKRHAAAYTLGSIVGTMNENGRSDEARQYNQKLVAELGKAETGEERQRLLMGLANAGMAENVPVIQKYAQDADPETRGTAAMALRKTQTEESERTLLDLTEDRDRNVQNTSLLMLSKYKTRTSHLEEIKSKIESGAITEDSYQIVLNLLVGNLSTYRELVHDICRLMLEKGVRDANLAKQIRALMER